MYADNEIPSTRLAHALARGLECGAERFLTPIGSGLGSEEQKGCRSRPAQQCEQGTCRSGFFHLSHCIRPRGVRSRRYGAGARRDDVFRHSTAVRLKVGPN